MALDFETEFPRTSSSYLSPEQRHQFFLKLKQAVVIVRTELVKPGGGFAKGRKYERPGSSNTTCPIVHQGAGVVLDENGTILTSAYLVPDNLQTILVRREVDEAFWEAKFEAKSPQHDLAIIVPKKNVGPFAFATLDTEGSFRIGKEVLSICHVGNLSYTSVVGQLACQDHILYRDVRDDEDIAPLRSEKLDRDLKLLQINNCHGSPRASGAPVFSSSGRVIGLSSFVFNKFDFAVHLTILERFYNSYQEREGNERGESHRK